MGPSRYDAAPCPSPGSGAHRSPARARGRGTFVSTGAKAYALANGKAYEPPASATEQVRSAAAGLGGAGSGLGTFHVESWFDHPRDQLLRRLLLKADLGLEVPESLRRALGQVVGAKVEFELAVASPNEPVTVKPPANPLPPSALSGG